MRYRIIESVDSGIIRIVWANSPKFFTMPWDKSSRLKFLHPEWILVDYLVLQEDTCVCDED